jgi:hypothetical protein
VTYDEAEKILQVYSLEEILELNDFTLEDTLLLLVEQKVISISLPEPL